MLVRDVDGEDGAGVGGKGRSAWRVHTVLGPAHLQESACDPFVPGHESFFLPLFVSVTNG